MEMKLTGILSTSLRDPKLPPGAPPPFGLDVAPGVVATNHQHLFCARIDPAIDCGEGARAVVCATVCYCVFCVCVCCVLLCATVFCVCVCAVCFVCFVCAVCVVCAV